MRAKKVPIRMCIVCRKREEQKKLLRLQVDENEKVVFYQGRGRSFYLCSSCIEKKTYLNKKRTRKIKINLSNLEELLEGVKINVKN